MYKQKPQCNGKITKEREGTIYDREMKRKEILKTIESEKEKNNKIKEDEEINKNCTFRPKINEFNREVFTKNKSFANEKDNAAFILRYTKARDEYLIRKLKKISTKDDSYEYSLSAVTSRICEPHYKNTLNVNNDILLGLTILKIIKNSITINQSYMTHPPVNYKKSNNFSQSTNYRTDNGNETSRFGAERNNKLSQSQDDSNYITIKDREYIDELRKELRSIDLDSQEEE